MTKLGIHRPLSTILVESLVVGVIFAVLFAALASIPAIRSDKVSLADATLLPFGTAVLGHWFFEATGLNQMYCDYAKW